MDDKRDRPAKVVPLRQRQSERQKPKPRPVEICPHGTPLAHDCPTCRGIGPEDDGREAPSADAGSELPACSAPSPEQYVSAVMVSEGIALALEWAEINRLGIDRKPLEQIEEHARAMRVAFARNTPSERQAHLEKTRVGLTANAAALFAEMVERISSEWPIDAWRAIEDSVCEAWAGVLAGGAPDGG
jgi:hypothetical protein